MGRRQTLGLCSKEHACSRQAVHKEGEGMCADVLGDVQLQHAVLVVCLDVLEVCGHRHADAAARKALHALLPACHAGGLIICPSCTPWLGDHSMKEMGSKIQGLAAQTGVQRNSV